MKFGRGRAGCVIPWRWTCFLWVTLTLVCFSIEFLAWAYAPGNMVPTSFAPASAPRGGGLAWAIMSFPLFYCVPGPTVEAFFWWIVALNSFFWGTLATILFLVYVRR